MTYKEAVKKYGELDEWHKHRNKDIMSWTGPVGVKGPMLFSFDRGKHVYNVFGGGKNELTQEEMKIFERESKLMCDIYVENKGGR